MTARIGAVGRKASRLGGSPPAVEESQVNALIAEGETGHRSPQDVVDEIHAAAETEAGVTDGHAYGRIGRRFDRRSPFYIGLTGALGVAVVWALGTIVLAVGQILLLVALAIVIAVGLDPPVAWLHRRRMPRGAAVAIVLAVARVFVSSSRAVPVLITQGTALAKELPHYLHSLNNHHTFLGKINKRYHIITALQKFISKGGSSAIASGVLGVGKVVVDLIGAVVVVLILSIYLLADLPRVKRGIYELAPASRRPRVVLLTDEILTRIGGYVLGNLFTSFVAGLGTWVWALALACPVARVALLDLIPIIGSTIGGIIVLADRRDRHARVLCARLLTVVATLIGVRRSRARGENDAQLAARRQQPAPASVSAAALPALLLGLIGAALALGIPYALLLGLLVALLDLIPVVARRSPRARPAVARQSRRCKRSTRGRRQASRPEFRAALGQTLAGSPGTTPAGETAGDKDQAREHENEESERLHRLRPDARDEHAGDHRHHQHGPQRREPRARRDRTPASESLAQRIAPGQSARVAVLLATERSRSSSPGRRGCSRCGARTAPDRPRGRAARCARAFPPRGSRGPDAAPAALRRAAAAPLAAPCWY